MKRASTDMPPSYRAGRTRARTWSAITSATKLESGTARL
jgi:hypothetical protein